MWYAETVELPTDIKSRVMSGTIPYHTHTYAPLPLSDSWLSFLLVSMCDVAMPCHAATIADITVLLSYLAEVQHVVKHMVQKMLDQQRIERETSRNFMARNAMLTEHCMINEETIQAKHRELAKMSESLRQTRTDAEQQRQRHDSTVRKLVRLVDDAGHRNHSFGRYDIDMTVHSLSSISFSSHSLHVRVLCL